VRVTQKMMIDQVNSNLSRNISQLMDLQSQLSSGRRIRTPSDDPVGVTRDLSYRSQLSNIDQFKRNISWGGSVLASAEQSLGSIAELIHRAKEIATALANDTYDASARKSAAQEVESIFESILSTGNSTFEGRYIFAGHRTRTAAFSASSNGVVYQGNQGKIEIDISERSRLQVNLIGSETLMTPLMTLGDGFDLNPGVTRDRLLADLNAGSGVDFTASQLVDVTDNNTGVTATIDFSTLPVDPTVGDVIDTINAELAAGGITNLTATVSPVGDAIRLTPTANGIISTQTALANLNNGVGIDQSTGTFLVTDGAGTDIVVDLSGLTTVGEVITAFDTQVAAVLGPGVVTMNINPGGTGLNIVDSTGPPPLGLSVEEINGRATANDLGLIGYIGSQLDGADLNPQSDFMVAENGGTVAADLGLLGSFNVAFDGADIDPVLVLDTPIDDLNSNLGFNLGQLRIAQGDAFRTVDLSAAVTIGDVISALNNTGLPIIASLNSDNTGIQVVPTDNTQSLIISDVDSSGTAGILGISGSPDIFGTMRVLIDALNNDDQKVIGRVIGALGNAGNSLLEQRASVGAKILRLETTEYRLTELSLSVTELLSEVEDADILKVTVTLAGQENMYQAALNAAARILSSSLIDFMR